ncbi:MAG: DUF6056 family protein [Muribaculaceae bacterium]
MLSRPITHSYGSVLRTRITVMWILTAFIGIAFGVIFFLQPDANDEYWYKSPMIPFLKEPSLGAFFESMWDCCKYHYLYDNGRLANVVGALLLLTPRWLSALILGGAVAYCCVISARLAGIWRKSVPAYIALVFLWVFALPWNDKMLTLIYSYNYVCGAALSLMLLSCTLRAKKMSIIASFALALITGLWHEGYSGPTLCAIAALAVVHGRYRTKRVAAIILGLALGITYLWLAPGTGRRSAGIVLGVGFRDLRLGWYYGVICYGAIAIILLRSFSRRIRHAFTSSPMLITMTAATLAAWGVWRYFMFGSRTAFACSAFAIVLFMALTSGRLRLRRQRRRHSAIHRYVIAGASMSCCALIAVNLTATISGIANISECSRIMIERYRLTPNDDIYIPLKMPWQMSIWTFGKVDDLWIITPGMATYHKDYLFGPQSQVSKMRPVPCGLKGFTPDKAKLIGIGEEHKAYIFGHVIVFDAVEYACQAHQIAYHFRGKTVEFCNFVMPFYGADGKEYVYSVPNGCLNEALLYGEPTAAEIYP